RPITCVRRQNPRVKWDARSERDPGDPAPSELAGLHPGYGPLNSYTAGPILTGMARPPLKREPRSDTRHTILEAGIRSVLKRGYERSGLAEILREAGVPKGSFYYYFASKEDFGLQLIEHWLENYGEAEASLKDETLSPLTRVRRFFEAR